MTLAIQPYIDLLKEYNEHTNIYSKHAYDKLPIHIQDCIALSKVIPTHPQIIADIGSGSGLPVIPLSILCPQHTLFAVESKSRKTTFLTQTKETLRLNNLHIIHKNVFEWRPQLPISIITAKAFGSLEKVITISKKINQSNATIIIPISKNQVMDYQKIATIRTQGSHLYAIYQKDNLTHTT